MDRDAFLDQVAETGAVPDRCTYAQALKAAQYAGKVGHTQAGMVLLAILIEWKAVNGDTYGHMRIRHNRWTSSGALFDLPKPNGRPRNGQPVNSSVRPEHRCYKCGGFGIIDRFKTPRNNGVCSDCCGVGVTPTFRSWAFYKSGRHFKGKTPCDTCRGSGQHTAASYCRTCGGTGELVPF